MRRATMEKKIAIANDLMFYIFTHIDTDINLDEQAVRLGVDRVYMHKIFKEIFGRNIYESIKAIRMQKAANLLLTNRLSTVSEIALQCGYASQTSFIRAFKQRFGMTPLAWRKGGYASYSARNIRACDAKRCVKKGFEDVGYEIVKRPEISAYYLRHQGYSEAIRHTWQKLHTWLYTNGIERYEELSLFHDNPAVTPLEDCHYVACVRIDDADAPLKSRIPRFSVAGGVYAKFTLQGCRGDLLEFIRWVYHDWLPASGFETTTKPPYAVYRRNHHTDKEGRFDMDFYLSVRY